MHHNMVFCKILPPFTCIFSFVLIELPFAVEMPSYNQKTLDAMAEARRISRDPDVKGYSSMEDLKAALDD